MTHLAVLSDIHGNLPALEAVMTDMAQFEIDRVIVAGDIINWGPQSAEVIEIVTREGWAVIRGNNEFYLLNYNTPRQPAHWVDYSLLPWLYGQLKGRWHNLIATWPDELSLQFPDAPPIRVFHASPADHWRGIHPLMSDAEIAAKLENVTEPVAIGAHTHLGMNRQVGRWQMLNPGSVGVPLDGLGGASYMLLRGDASGWQPTFRRVPFATAPVLAAFEAQHFVEEYGTVARLVMKEFETARMHVHPFNVWKRTYHPDAPVTESLVQAFEQADPWPYIPLEYHLNRS